MYSTLTSFPSPQTSILTSRPLFTPNHFPPPRRLRRVSVKFSHKPLNSHPLPLKFDSIPFRPIPISPPPSSSSSSSSSSSIKTEENSTVRRTVYDGENVLERVAKPIVFTLFFILIGLCPVMGFRSPAIAAPVAASERIERTKRKGNERESGGKGGHEYSDCTRRLLETVSGLLRAVENVRSGNGDLKGVEAALREVKSKKKELQEEIMSGMYAELRELKREKEELVKRSEGILDSALKAKRERDNLLRKEGGDEVKEQIAKLEEEMRNGENEYNGIWEDVGEIEDRISRRETMALSIGIRELSFIERESEALVENFKRQMMRPGVER